MKIVMKDSKLGANKNYMKENLEIIKVPTKIDDNLLESRGPYKFMSGAIY